MTAHRAITDEDIPVLLEGRHTMYLEWCEPWPACGPEGNHLDAMVTLRSTVHNCINMQRATERRQGLPTTGDDERHLREFIAVHWADVVVPDSVQRTDATDCSAVGSKIVAIGRDGTVLCEAPTGQRTRYMFQLAKETEADEETAT